MWKTNKSNIYQSGEYKQFVSLRIINIGIIIFIISIICYGIYFINKNVFNAITQAEEIIVLKDSLISEVIDFPKYDKVSETWNEKNETIAADKKNLNDPFNIIITTSTLE